MYLAIAAPKTFSSLSYFPGRVCGKSLRRSLAVFFQYRSLSYLSKLLTSQSFLPLWFMKQQHRITSHPISSQFSKECVIELRFDITSIFEITSLTFSWPGWNVPSSVINDLKMESPCGRFDEDWLGISIFVPYFRARSVSQHASN